MNMEIANFSEMLVPNLSNCMASYPRRIDLNTHHHENLTGHHSFNCGYYIIIAAGAAAVAVMKRRWRR
jgi:hypothetical protein